MVGPASFFLPSDVRPERKAPGSGSEADIADAKQLYTLHGCSQEVRAERRDDLRPHTRGTENIKRALPGGEEDAPM